MRILMVCMQHDYGNPARGLSYEYFNFAQAFEQMGIHPDSVQSQSW